MKPVADRWRGQSCTARAEPYRWLAFALFAVGFLLMFRHWLSSGFDATFGDKEDGYIALAVIEHWHHVFTGAAHWSDPIFFYPDGSTSDARLLLVGERHATVRMMLRGVMGSVAVGDVTSADR